MRKISADYIYSMAEKPQKDAVIVINDDGIILDLLANADGLMDVEHYKGHITPGFINSHCHLELSHLAGKIEKHLGIVSFVLKVQELRSAPIEEIDEAMQSAEQQMIANGIVAVGDISNTENSFEIKRNSPIDYHTFIELFGFNPEHASNIFQAGLQLQKKAGQLKTSITAHAPYSVSEKLFEEINKLRNNLWSIHNQESEAENKFFENKTGDFIKLYTAFGIDISFFSPTKKSSLESYLPNITSKKIAMVHNTFSSSNDIKFAKQTSNEIFWCVCAKANQFIENTIPKIDLLLENDCSMLIGTDSLASNNSLSILEEINCIKSAFPNISYEELFKWGTINGAAFLGKSALLGSIEKNKKPGLNLISADFKTLKKII